MRAVDTRVELYVGEASPDDPSIGLRIGRYTIARTLGRGAMGVVYAARHDLTQQLVALKTLNLQPEGGQELLAEERFLREIKAAISLHHPGIVRVHEFDRTAVPGLGQVLYYAMEMIDGVTLHELLQRGALAPDAAAAIGVQVCEALDFAHRRGVVHRDVKPANIFIDRGRRVILTDFGICKLDGMGTLTAAGAVVGTLPFLAPEQAIERPVDARSDVFAVGAVLFTLLARTYLRSVKPHLSLRQAATPGQDEQRVRGTLRCDPALVEVVARAVAWEPERRFQSARELGEALRRFAGQVPAPWPDDEVAANVPTLEMTADRIASPDSGPAAPALATGELFDRSAPWLTPPTSSAPAEAPARDAPRPVSGLSLPPVPGPADDLFAELERTAAASPPPPRGPAAAPLPLYTPGGAAPPTGAQPLRPADLAPRSAAPGAEPATPRGSVASEISGRRLVSGTRSVAPHLDAPARARSLLQVPALRWGALATALVLALGALVPWFLRRQPIALAVETMPPGAEVRINGQRVGITPLTHVHPDRRGELRLEVLAFEREPYVKSLALPLRGTLPPLTIAMPLLRAALRVETRPAGARVLVDGEPACTSPCEVSALAPRVPHLVRVVREGCAAQTTTLTPEPAERLLHRAALPPLTVHALTLLQVVGAGGRVLLDGEDRTRAFADGALLVTAGRHVLELGEGEAARRWILHLSPRTAQRLDLRRRPRPPAPPALKREGARELEGVAAVADDDLTGGTLGGPAGASVERLVDYGIYLLSLGQVARAEPYLTQALALDAQSPAAHRAIIAAAVMRGDEKLALGQMTGMLNLQTTLHDGELLREVFGGRRQAERCAEALQREDAEPAPAPP